ncbi:hypothetical protein C2845_PM05G35290 [Panicum miliaceum]|uniref:Uncharacterized protein n=1 Tax=Panicum miliaceum TaxID=4540 RepID=A0A3L6SY29_PANMI|nr:hypothetical protein C2845_PM05G35290 [Panicum miliaceum]
MRSGPGTAQRRAKIRMRTRRWVALQKDDRGDRQRRCWIYYQEERESCIEFYHQYVGGGGYSAKEKRPPLKRGQLKRQIVRTISKLVAPSGAGDGGRASNQAVGRKFRREASSDN